MDKYKNYYSVLGLSRIATAKEIKLAYYKLSKELHPDKLTGDNDNFFVIKEAYKVLSNEKDRNEYDTKSKFGGKYSEFNEIYDFEFNNDAKSYDKDKYEEFVKRDQLNVLVYIDDTFNGIVEYERWVYCKSCEGSGMDKSSKMSFKDADGNIIFIDIADDCEFCEGTGKWGEVDCFYCSGLGKINGNKCEKCNGEKRILGKQKVNNIKIPKDAKDYKVEHMGNVSRDIPGKTGHLWLIKK